MRRMAARLWLVLAWLGQMSASSICVKVTTEEPDLTPLRGIRVLVVRLDEPSAQLITTTDKQGEACLEHLAEGIYSVEASGEGMIGVRYYPVRVTFPNSDLFRIRLPFGEIREGGFGETESTFSGTLLEDGVPVVGFTLCLFAEGQQLPTACTKPNDLGQYVLIVPAAKYRLDLTKGKKLVKSSKVDLSPPGIYRNLASLDAKP
jgi:hypothetical protein